MPKFVVQLPGGVNKLVDVPSNSTLGQVRSNAGLGPSSLVFNSESFSDSTPVSRFPELSTFSVLVATQQGPPTAPPISPQVSECMICLEVLGSGNQDAPVQALQCGHSFHSVCLREWSLHSTYCPLCRSIMAAPPGAAPSVIVVGPHPAKVERGPPR